MQLYADRWQTLRQGALSYLSTSEVISNQMLRIGQATATAQGIPPAGQRKQRIRTMETWPHDRANWLTVSFHRRPRSILSAVQWWQPIALSESVRTRESSKTQRMAVIPGMVIDSATRPRSFIHGMRRPCSP